MNHMSTVKKRKVGERGQVTIPKEIRDKQGIKGGDQVEIKEEDGSVIIKKENNKEKLKEGYQKMANRDKKISEEMIAASKEALN